MKKFSKSHFSKAQRKLNKKLSSEELNNISGGSSPEETIRDKMKDIPKPSLRDIIDSTR